MGSPQIIKTDGEDLVILTRADYEALLAQAGHPPAEDAATARILAETGRAIAVGDDVALPESVWEQVEAGANAILVLRKLRGLTQAQLAAALGVQQGHVSDLENGRRRPTVATMQDLARALRAPMNIFIAGRGDDEA